MRICCYADTHGTLFDCPPCDLLLLAGDIGPDIGKGWYAQSFLPFVKRLEARGTAVVWVCGNHDHELHKDWRFAKSLGGAYLSGQETTARGVRVWGSGYVPVCGPSPGDWADHWSAIPDGVDVVLLHGPPRGMGDAANTHVGCEHLGRHLKRARPKLVVFGHNHSANGYWVDENTVYVNCTSGQHGPGKEHPPALFDWPPAGFRTPTAAAVPGVYSYNRVGLGTRRLALEPGGVIGEGAAACERSWRMVTGADGEPRLVVQGDRQHGDVIRLRADRDGGWVGRWTKYERNRVILTREA